MATQQTYEIEIFEGITELDEQRWDALVADESPFLAYGFLSLLERTGCTGEQSGWFPMIMVARRAGERDGEFLGALPLYVKTNSAGEFVFDWGWADAAQRAGIAYYPKAVVAVPFSPVTGRRVLLSPSLSGEESHALALAMIQTATDFAEKSGLSSVHFNFITPAEVPYFQELSLPIRYGMQYHWYNGKSRGEDGPYEDFDEFLARFRSKRRANIRRERRKLVQAGVTARVARGDQIDEAMMSRMFDYYRDTVQKFFYGRQYLTREFFLQLPDVMPEQLHFVLMSQDGEEFGGTFNLCKDRRLYGRYWGARADVEFAHFEACMYTPIEWCIANGFEVFEPGAGGDHKYERGFEPTRMHSAHFIADSRLDMAVRQALAQERAGQDLQIEYLSRENPFKDT